jgi:hypothetical protein
LLKAFEHSDAAHKESFGILLLESKILGEEEIHLIKEEPLFNDFVLINQNLNELNSEKIENEETYAGFYLLKAQKFNSLIKQTGFEKVIVEEFSPLDLLDKYDEHLVEEAVKEEKSLFIPIISDVLPAFVSYLNNIFQIKTAVNVLQVFPSFEFMQSYSDFLGTQNSSASLFAGMLEEESLHRQQLSQRNKDLQDSIESKIAETEESISLFKKYDSFDENFFVQLNTLLNSTDAIVSQNHAILDLENAGQQTSNRLNELKISFFDLQQKDFLDKISLGKKTSSLKELNNDLELLQQNISFLQEDIVSGLDVLCQERIATIEQSLSETPLPPELVLASNDLKTSLLFNIGLFNSSEETDERLFQCNQIMESFHQFNLSLNDPQQFLLQENSSFNECMDFLDKLFSVENHYISLMDFLPRYIQLKSIAKPYDDIAKMNSHCSKLREDIVFFINQFPRTRKAVEELNETENFLQTLEKIQRESDNSSLAEELNRLKKFFSGNNLNIDLAFPILDDVFDSISKLHSKTKQELDTAISLFIEENIAQQLLDLSQSENTGIQEEAFSILTDLNSFLDEDFTAEKLDEFLALMRETDELQSLEEQSSLAFAESQQLEEEEVSLEEESVEVEKEETISNLKKDLQDLHSLQEELLSIISPFSDADFIEARYVLPITKQRLETIGEQLNEIEGFLAREELADFESLAEKENLVENIERELQSAMNTLKEDALVSYNSAVSLFNEGSFNEEAEELLTDSESKLKQGNLLESLMSSKKASSLLSTGKNDFSLPQTPIFLIPMAAALLLIGFLRFKKINSKKNNNRKQKIIRNW